MHIYTHTCFRMGWGLKSKASLREGWSEGQGKRERRKERQGGKEALKHDCELYTNSVKDQSSKAKA